MKNNKGFSMVEILAAIAIVGILVGIAIPSVSAYIQESREKFNKQVEEQLLVSGKNYFSENVKLLPKLTYVESLLEGERKNYVTAPELSTGNYLKNELIDYDGETCEESYVLVVKNSSSKEEIWHPCLICGQGDDKKVHTDDPYCGLNVNWDDLDRPQCIIIPSLESGGDKEKKIFSKDTIKLEFETLTDLPDTYEGKNYTSLVFYNKTTGKFIYEPVEGLSGSDIMQNIDLSKLLVEDGEYSISILDKGYNKSDACITGITIDNKEPSCRVEGNPENWVQSATLTSDASDNIGLSDNPYSWESSLGDKTSYSNVNTYYVDDKGTYISYVKDKAGNVATCDAEVTKIDTTPPEVPTFVSEFGNGTTYNIGDWTNKTVYTTITSSDMESKIKEMQYQKKGESTWRKFNFGAGLQKNNNDTEWVGKEEWTLENREASYYFRACDNAGNCSDKSEEYTIRYDLTKPTVTVSAKKKSAGTAVSSGSWSDEGLNFTFTIGDVGASGATIYYCKDKDNTCSPDTEATSGSVVTSYNVLNGSYYIRYKAVSGAGVSSGVSSYTAKVDSGVPTIEITAKKKTAGTVISSGTWSNQGLNFVFTLDDVGSSGATMYYCKDTANTCSPTTKATSGTSITSYNTLTGTYYIRYYVKGGNGKSSDVASFKARVDTTDPVITQTASKTAISSKYEFPVDITTTCSDSGGSTINTFTVNSSSVSDAAGTTSKSKVTTISSAGTTSIAAACKDKAGNSASKSGSFTTFKPVTSVAVSSIPSPLWIVVNGSDTAYQTSTAKVTVSPSTATNTGVTWSSSNTSVVSISSSGVMTPKGVGSATIKATAKDGTGKSASKKVYVYKAQTRSDTDISRATNGGTKWGNIVLTSHQVYATNGSGTVTLKVNGKHTSDYDTWLGTGSSASTSHCKSYARWICLTDSTASPTGSTNIPFSACDSSLKLVKSRTTKWSDGSSFCGKQSLTMSAEGTYYIMLGGGVSVTSCTSCGTESTKDFSADGSGEHINAKFTSYSLKIAK